MEETSEERRKRFEFDARPEALVHAQETVRDKAGSWGFKSIADDLVLCLSEALTNALTHTAHGETMAVEAWCCGPVIHIEVLDQDSHAPELKRPRELSDPLSPDHDLQECGRGLFLIDAVSERWGFAIRPPGKGVWFELSDPDLVGAV